MIEAAARARGKAEALAMKRAVIYVVVATCRRGPVAAVRGQRTYAPSVCARTEAKKEQQTVLVKEGRVQRKGR